MYTVVKMVTHKKARGFEISKLKKTPQKLPNSPEVTGIFHPPKFHLPQSQFSIRASKAFYCKVLSKLYRNGELNFLVNFNLIL